jgi:hypothetical protein
MDIISFWGADCCSADQFLITVWNLNVYYYVHKSLPPVCTLSQMNPLHISWQYLSTYFSILSSHPQLPSGLFSSVVPTKTPHSVLFSHICATHSPLPHLRYILPIATFSFICPSEWYLLRSSNYEVAVYIHFSSHLSLPAMFVPILPPPPAVRPPPLGSSCGLHTYLSANCVHIMMFCVTHIVRFTLCTF